MNESAPGRAGIIAGLIGLIAAVVASVLLFVDATDDDPEPARRKPVALRPDPTPRPAAPAAPDPDAGPLWQRLAPTPQPLPTEHAAVRQPGPGAEITELLTLARRIESTQPKRSRELLQRVLELNPHDETALARLSKKMYIDEKVKDAKALLDRCPDSEACKAMAANVADPQTRDQLVRMAHGCLHTMPDNLDCLYVAMDQDLFDGNIEAAALRGLLMNERGADSALTKLAFGRLKASQGAYAEARALFDAACNLGNEVGCFRANMLKEEGF